MQRPVSGSQVASEGHEQRIEQPGPWTPGGHSARNTRFIGRRFTNPCV